ncbi:hypothetical protein AB0M54_39245 [Actinoplanes sp. NPDC051470]|uniref:hypothetical protein n=1 Tax=Actinoplanes sp. NPDC051470 TaxID=3157224 RepID=UPI00341711D9
MDSGGLLIIIVVVLVTIPVSLIILYAIIRSAVFHGLLRFTKAIAHEAEIVDHATFHNREAYRAYDRLIRATAARIRSQA